jgi:hypothetical protein
MGAWYSWSTSLLLFQGNCYFMINVIFMLMMIQRYEFVDLTWDPILYFLENDAIYMLFPHLV